MKLPSLPDKIKGLFSDEPKTTAEKRTRVAILTPLMVWEAPANYNRATRRWAKLWGRIWKWDSAALGQAKVPPRYVRRHFKDSILLAPRSRRERRHRARILPRHSDALFREEPADDAGHDA